MVVWLRGFLLSPAHAITQAAHLEKASAKLARLKKEALHQLLDVFELPRGSGEEGHKVSLAPNIRAGDQGAPPAGFRRRLGAGIRGQPGQWRGAACQPIGSPCAAAP